MRFYKGALTFNDIMEMPYVTFMMFYEYMVYIHRMDSEDGRKQNRMTDRALEIQYGVKSIDDDMGSFKKAFQKRMKVKK